MSCMTGSLLVLTNCDLLKCNSIPFYPLNCFPILTPVFSCEIKVLSETRTEKAACTAVSLSS